MPGAPSRRCGYLSRDNITSPFWFPYSRLAKSDTTAFIDRLSKRNKLYTFEDPGTFPLSISSNGKYLQSASGNPTLLIGQAAWLLPMQATYTQQQSYLDDISSRGYNAAYVQVFGARSDHSNDSSAAGNNPFTNISTLTVNSAYLDDLALLTSYAKSKGVLLQFSFYYGYAADGADGYWNEFVAGGASACRTMAAAVAARLVSYGNVMYQIGGDYMPPNATISDAIFDGIRDSDGTCLITGYWGSESPGTTSRDLVGRAWYQLCGVSSWGEPHELTAAVYGAGTPVSFQEGKYEHNDNYGWSRKLLRLNALNCFLRGALGGMFYGNEYTWGFDSTTQPAQSGAPVGHSYTEYLGDPGCLDLARIGSFITSFPNWSTLVPDASDTLITAGKGSGQSYVGAAKSTDSTLAIIYAPTNTTFTVVRSQMTSSFTARWWDPTTGSFSTIGTGISNSGTQNFTAATNSGGDPDQVLVLTCP